MQSFFTGTNEVSGLAELLAMHAISYSILSQKVKLLKVSTALALYSPLWVFSGTQHDLAPPLRACPWEDKWTQQRKASGSLESTHKAHKHCNAALTDLEAPPLGENLVEGDPCPYIEHLHKVQGSSCQTTQGHCWRTKDCCALCLWNPCTQAACSSSPTASRQTAHVQTTGTIRHCH